MPLAIVDAFRRGMRSAAYGLAFGLAMVPVSAFVVRDIWLSIREVQALQSGASCATSPPPCASVVTVTLEGPFDERRDGFENWWTVDHSIGNVSLLRSAAARADLRPGPETAYVVDGHVVAIGDPRVPTALSGSHAVFVDSAGLLAAVSLGAGTLRAVRTARRSGVGWSDPVRPRQLGRPAPRTPPEIALAAVGCLGFLLSVRGGLDVGPSIATTGVVVVLLLTVPRLWRRWRRATTKGRHAAY